MTTLRRNHNWPRNLQTEKLLAYWRQEPLGQPVALAGRVIPAKVVRQIAHQLHPSILEDLGLAAALRELCEAFSARARIEATFVHEATPEALPVDGASCLLSMAP